jgi:sugar phosphate isomerase/epimerase
MKLGIVSSALDCDFEAELDRFQALGLDAIEIGGYHADRRFGDPARLLQDAGELDRWTDAIATRGLEVSTLALHGAPLSPDRAVAPARRRGGDRANRVVTAVALNMRELTLNGVLDSGPFEELAARSWSFRTVGYAHDELYWRAFVSVLRELGYDDVVSIEHEDLYMSAADGLANAVEFLRPLLPSP